MMRKRLVGLVLFAAIGGPVWGQPVELANLGQTPGGSAFNLTYDSETQRLFVGCGSSIWVYDVSDVTHPVRTAMRPFRGLVTEMVLAGATLFAATTHDGLWALSAESPTLEPFYHFPTPGDSAAYDLYAYGDSLYLANGFQAILLYYHPATGFTEIRRFGTPRVMTVARRGDMVATGSWTFLTGTVAVYHTADLSNPVATWVSGEALNLQDLQFADRRDDIIYVCGGTNNLAFTGRFFALQLQGDSLPMVGHFTIPGIPGWANAQIINMDSRNDTLFLATTAGLYQNESDVPVLDATGLPDDSLRVIAHIRPGLWHFDVALFSDRPYLAIASEWYGVWINDISTLQPLDTVAVIPTGGWCQRAYVHHDTLWACMRGYGLVAFDIDSLLYPPRSVRNPELLRLPKEFTVDFTLVDDSLCFLARGTGTTRYSLYNLAPWYRGGSPESRADFGYADLLGSECITSMTTDVGPRLAGGLVNGTIEIYNPYDRNHPRLSATALGGHPQELIAEGDTLWTGALIGGVQAIAAYRVTQDTLLPIRHCEALGQVTRLAKASDIVVAACGAAGMAWYRVQPDTLIELGRITDRYIVDVHLVGNRLYAAEQLTGLRVYDLSQPDTAILVAVNPGSGGWQGGFGSTSVTVGSDQRICLSDFNSGTFVIEPAPSGIAEAVRLTAYGLRLTAPTVVRGVLEMAVDSRQHTAYRAELLDVSGRMLLDLHPGPNDVSRFAPGVYFVRSADSNARAAVRKVVIAR
jgi:hypothetical protein